VIFYLTFNDAPSGIFSSQVIDVVKFFKSELNLPIRLISFISVRGFFLNRKKIKYEMPTAIVLPMFPGVHRWRLNSFTLKIVVAIFKPTTIVGRSVFATKLALLVKKNNSLLKVIYDGRAAVKAEWDEYNVVTNPQLVSSIYNLEIQCVLETTNCIAVSNELVNYWRKDFGYNTQNFVVIPCTLNLVFEKVVISEKIISENRRMLNFNSDDVVFVYSGSLAGWQSIDLIYNYLNQLLEENAKHKVLFLSDKDSVIEKLHKSFPNQVYCKKVAPTEVPNLLVACDYGLLIREKSITNKVASPVKFAEYLACGLDVLISEELGDYTEFVKQNKCGFIYSENPSLKIVEMEKKLVNQQLAKRYFTKQVFKNSYSKIA
jgi:hypothetical protein